MREPRRTVFPSISPLGPAVSSKEQDSLACAPSHAYKIYPFLKQVILQAISSSHYALHKHYLNHASLQVQQEQVCLCCLDPAQIPRTSIHEERPSTAQTGTKMIREQALEKIMKTSMANAATGTYVR
ncbi:hypothetical protein EDD11_006377 [Mortierella claussenii]|nr:hypothetical protein EDD11_006377 [Mortierella claussenii]